MTDQNQSQGDTGAGDGEQTSFLDTIESEELRGNEALSGFENLDGLAEDYVKIRASQPVVPEDTEGYAFEVPEEIRYDEEKNPDGVRFDETANAEFKQFALENNITPDQYSALMQYQTEMIQKANEGYVKQQNESGEEAVTRRKAEYGAGYDVAVENSLKTLAAFDIDLKDDPIVNDDRVFGLLAKIGGAISEGKLNAGGGGFNKEAEKGEDGKAMLSFPSMQKKA